MANIEHETLALAALFQACNCIERVARQGYQSTTDIAPLLRGLIITNPKTCEDIYNPSDLRTGYNQLMSSFGFTSKDKSKDTLEITSMAFKLITLEQAIEKNTEYFNKLGQNIDRVRDTILIANPNYENASPNEIVDSLCISEFSNLYQSIISPNFPKLIIYGEQEHLSKDENQSLIRALLLSAIRSIVLWRQVGGRRRFFIFRRKAILQCAMQKAPRLN